MTLLRPLVLLPLLVLVVGCASQPPTEQPPKDQSPTGSARMVVFPSQAIPSGDIGRVTVTASSADMSAFSVELVPMNGAWEGVLHRIPVGVHRTFLAQAFNAAGTLLQEGRVEEVCIAADVLTPVSITLTPITNEAPIINLVAGAPLSVTPGGRVTLTASARDPNPGDPLVFSWTARLGSFEAPSQANTSWTAPAGEGSVTLSLTVTDSRGATSQATLVVTVSSWNAVASMSTIRTMHTATLLPNGKVLVTGGHDENNEDLATAEVYDPATKRWSAVSSMASFRTVHTATLLSNGKVLVVGGLYHTLQFIWTADVYDPATGTWSQASSRAPTRIQHTATLLPSGQVLVTGGLGRNGGLATAEVYTP